MIKVTKNIEFKNGKIKLPTSKSLSNRALVIRELAGNFNINHLSDSDDTQNLIKNIHLSSETIDVGAAGTNMRFLVSMYSALGKQKTITGSERMMKRPIGKLVEALREIGANITYQKAEGFPPVVIHPQIPDGGEISIDGSESSQYISSLLMIAPILKKGLKINIINNSVSSPYIQMTIELMKYFGVECDIKDKTIQVLPQKYIPKDYTVECDWSSAGFWYGLISASDVGVSIDLENLFLNSLQGDKKTAEYYLQLGVVTTATETGIRIEKKNKAKDKLHFHLINEPDLFPALAFSCATLKLNAEFTGLITLNLKESKRIDVMALELEKTGAICEYSNDHLNITGYKSVTENIVFNSHDDHRIAMAASIYSIGGTTIHIENPGVVTKSYTRFWDDLKSIRIVNIY